MTLTIELTPEEEARLQAVAGENGMAPADYARQLLTEGLPSATSAEKLRSKLPSLSINR